MKRWFIVWIGFLLLPLLGCQPALSANAQSPPETVDLRRQVQLLNLINGLELTSEQMRFVLEKAQAAQEMREELKAEADAEELTAVLEELREALMQGENISQELKERYWGLHRGSKGLMEEYQEEATRLAQEIEAVLEEHQLYALEQYVPCIIPPEGELRIGQAQGAGGGAALERLRAIPDDRFERHKEDIARRVMERLEERVHGRVLILDEEDELNRILDLMERARALSDVDFELRREALVEELLEPYDAARPEPDVTAIIARHLLDPAIIPLLEEKLALAGE